MSESKHYFESGAADRINRGKINFVSFFLYIYMYINCGRFSNFARNSWRLDPRLFENRYRRCSKQPKSNV